MSTPTPVPVDVPSPAPAPAPLARVETELPTGETPADHRKLAETVTTTLERTFAALPERVRRTATLYVLAGDYSTFAVRRFAERCHNTERRLRPSDSLALETSELIRPFTTASEHRGSCYVLDGPFSHALLPEAGPRAPEDAAAVVCELSRTEDGFRVTATAWTPARDGGGRQSGREEA